MNFWQKLWAFLSGNKTIIGTILLYIFSMDPVMTALGASYSVIVAIIGLLTGASLLSHAKKGYFSTKKIEIKREKKS
ncbi:MAG: hypothetical protein EOL88_10325 [Bacteroidia bacterium]|nr:hypothetical protein [Bacteroidales bacterium]NCD42475.1 hypothetical protein [Bacteroidia bacterium]HPG11690.1 hypothetical protein [Chitinophagaceae bacterium]MDD3010152.1 hypothetical protein [Bacteroidales bacterium]MDD3962137.1 hypothetical protein [Bacteroidales bacterium]